MTNETASDLYINLQILVDTFEHYLEPHQITPLKELVNKAHDELFPSLPHKRPYGNEKPFNEKEFEDFVIQTYHAHN